MKKTHLLSILMVFFLAQPLCAQSPDTFNIYLAGKFGYSATFVYLKDTLTQKKRHMNLSSFNIGTAFGGQYYFMDPFGLRIEFEYLFRTKDKTRSSQAIPSSLAVTAHTILTNVYLDWHITPKIAVYTQAGLGASIIDLDYEQGHLGTKSSYGGVVWQAGLGTWYAITKDTIIDFSARYVGYTTQTIRTLKVSDFSGVDLLFSFRYLF